MRFSTKRDMTDLEKRLIDSVAAQAAFDGWSDEALQMACEEQEVDFAVASEIFPNRPLDLLIAHSHAGDLKLVETLAGQDWFETQKVRDKIKTLVMTRFDQNLHLREAIRRGTSILSMPQNAPAGTKALARTVDTMWNLAGDTATDYNRYTKRALLGGVYSSSLLVWLNDTSEDMSATDAFVTRRIENVLSIFGTMGKATSGLSGLFSKFAPSR